MLSFLKLKIMKKIFIFIGLTLLFISCGAEDSGIDSGSSNDDSTNEVLAEVDPCEDISSVEDISDSLIIMLDEILDKKCDYNGAKFDVAMKKWEGRKIEVSGLTINSLSVEDQYTGNNFTADYGDQFKCGLLPNSITFFVDVDSKESLAKYEVGDIVSVRGLISPENKSGNMGYYIHLRCEEVSSVEKPT
jgi:hypothetical protein